MSDDLQDLYRQRAELVDLESDCDDAMKYARRGGVFYRCFGWIKRVCEADRRQVQTEIDELTRKRIDDE